MADQLQSPVLPEDLVSEAIPGMLGGSNALVRSLKQEGLGWFWVEIDSYARHLVVSFGGKTCSPTMAMSASDQHEIL